MLQSHISVTLFHFISLLEKRHMKINRRRRRRRRRRPWQGDCDKWMQLDDPLQISRY
jgi:hypothetical protein